MVGPPSALTFTPAAGCRQEQEEEVPEETIVRQNGFPQRPAAPTLSGAPSAAKIEELRDLCEQQLGDELFIKVYKHLREHMNMEKEDCSADERLQQWLDKELGPARLNHFQIHIFRLIMYEDMVYS